MSVLEAVLGSGERGSGGLRMSVAIVTRWEDNSTDRGREVNHNAIRHECRLQAGPVPRPHADVIARVWLHGGGGVGERRVETAVGSVYEV